MVVRGLHALRGVHDLRGEHDAELHADVIGAEHFLAGDLEQRPARIDERNAEVLAPANVAACGERLDELAVVVEQAREAFGHDELMAVASADKVRHDEAGDREDENEDLFGGHGVCWLLVESCDSRRRPPVGSGQRDLSAGCAGCVAAALARGSPPWIGLDGSRTQSVVSRLPSAGLPMRRTGRGDAVRLRVFHSGGKEMNP